jgi:tetratricopeptide (TPR) repeat protein
MLDSGWSVESIDGWLAEMPKGKANFWFKQRLRFNMQHGRGEALQKELSENIRKNPKDIVGAISFLDALKYARRPDQEKPDFGWMADIIRPNLATESETIASHLKDIYDWSTAAEFYEQAIEIPLNDEEIRHLLSMCPLMTPTETVRAGFAVKTRENLSRCLLQLGLKKDAQRWMVEASDIREKYKFGRNSLFAGQVQAASGERTIEGRIKAEEEVSEDNPKYWSERAQYYHGRNESVEEEKALKNGLKLATIQIESEQHRRRHIDWRSRLLGQYALFLRLNKRSGEAVELLRREIEHTPADSVSAKKAANMLAFDFEKHLSVDDTVLWNWLGNRANWERTEERLLWRMLENAKRDDLERYFSRAEGLANETDASRSFALGWIMNRMEFPSRSILLLEYAVGHAVKKDLKDKAAFALLESYLDIGDWKHAEAIFPDAAHGLTPNEVPKWYGRIAVAAAKSDANADAMRIWARVANISPWMTAYVDEMVRVGLRNELKDFYRELQKKIPSSEIPGKVLTMLEEQ